ncbi:hypothetical protein ACHAXN_005681 [Cyclotella atomus]
MNNKAPSSFKRHRHGSSSEEEEEQPRMSSGHKLVLQTSSDFANAKAKLQKKKLAEMKSLSESTTEENTTYRDAEEEEEKSRLLNMCTYQRHKEEKAIEWFEEVKDVPLARRVGDGQLEERRRNVIRESDPMAMYAWKEEQMSNPTNGATSTIPIKPQYKGSLPTAKAELPKGSSFSGTKV